MKNDDQTILFSAPPLPMDRLITRISQTNAALDRVLQHSSLVFAGRHLESYESRALGGMTMLTKFVWIHESQGPQAGCWNKWMQFGADGYLIVESQTESQFGKPSRNRITGLRLGGHKSFASAKELFDYEAKLRETGLKLTAAYRRDRLKFLGQHRLSEKDTGMTPPTPPNQTRLPGRQP